MIHGYLCFFFLVVGNLAKDNFIILKFFNLKWACEFLLLKKHILFLLIKWVNHDLLNYQDNRFLTEIFSVNVSQIYIYK